MLATLLRQFALILSILSYPAHAVFEVNGTVQGGNVIWDNVTSLSSGGLTPSRWVAPPSLQSTQSWIPGTFSHASPTTMTLQGTGGSSSAIPVSIKGMQYNTTSVDYNLSPSSIGGGCIVDNIDPPIVELEGSPSGCVSNAMLTTTLNVSPFVLYRPIFDVLSNDIIDALEGLPEGTYTGSIPVSIRYYYINKGVTTYRNISELMMVSLKYSPVQLDSILVYGDGVMEPNYQNLEKRVQASTSYDITVNGYFNNGIVLTMPKKDYQLTHVGDVNVKIPYNVLCNQCNQVNLVQDGVLLNEVSSISEGNGIQTSINFSLDFNYDVEGEVLTSGDYNDQITIMLEPGI